jgi:hypothetical protein
MIFDELRWVDLTVGGDKWQVQRDYTCPPDFPGAYRHRSIKELRTLRGWVDGQAPEWSEGRPPSGPHSEKR